MPAGRGRQPGAGARRPIIKMMIIMIINIMITIITIIYIYICTHT